MGFRWNTGGADPSSANDSLPAFGQASRFGKHLPNRVSVEVAEVCTVQNLEREKFKERTQITDITLKWPIAHAPSNHGCAPKA